MIHKKCRKCFIEQPLSQFHRDKCAKDGYATKCKLCMKIKQQHYVSMPCDTPLQSKTCSTCKIGKSPEDFDRNKCGKDGLDTRCRDCLTENWLKRTYGIDMKKYLEMLNAQGGKCAICKQDQLDNPIRKKTGKPKAFDVDHCHATNKIRGLLCNPCNKGLSHFKDNATSLAEAAKYLMTLR